MSILASQIMRSGMYKHMFYLVILSQVDQHWPAANMCSSKWPVCTDVLLETQLAMVLHNTDGLI